MFPSTNFKTCCKKWHFIQNNRNKINKTINRSHVRCLIQFNLKERKKGPYDTKNSNKRMKYRFWACWTDSSYCKFCGWIDWIIKLTCWCVCVCGVHSWNEYRIKAKNTFHTRFQVILLNDFVFFSSTAGIGFGTLSKRRAFIFAF